MEKAVCTLCGKEGHTAETCPWKLKLNIGARVNEKLVFDKNQNKARIQSNAKPGSIHKSGLKP